MPGWTVEIDDALLEALRRGPRARLLEAAAVQRALEFGGPDALGVGRMDLEGVPQWTDLGAPVSLRLPNPSDGRRAIQLEVWPDRLVVLREFD